MPQINNMSKVLAVLGATGAGLLLLDGSPTSAFPPGGPVSVSFVLDYPNLTGKTSEGGVIGPAVNGFNVGKYIILAPNVVLRASTEVENNTDNGGSLRGN